MSVSPGTGYTTNIDNPFFPLIPGTVLTYTGTKDDRAAFGEFEVRSDTKTIDGVTCVITEDRLSLGGVLTERTLGYYAQDADGNVWYFGEDIQDIAPNGNVQAIGTWRAGLDGAPPMMIMPGVPTPGQSYEHRYTQTDFEVVSVTESLDVPAGSYSNVLLTKEWSPAEPNVLVHKYYASGVGMIRDVSVQGPYEEVVLESVAGP